MKKGSTTAANEIRNFSEAKLTIGLDLGDRSSWYCGLNQAGEVRLEQTVAQIHLIWMIVIGIVFADLLGHRQQHNVIGAIIRIFALNSSDHANITDPGYPLLVLVMSP